MTKIFSRELGDKATIRMSGEKGEIRSRAEHLDANLQYFLTYTAADGCQRTAWFYESDLEPVDITGIQFDDIPF